MARPLRLEFAHALYHVTARGELGGAIVKDEVDQSEWLRVLAKVCKRFNWVVHAYCQITKHYHLVVETPGGNLVRGMRQLNGHYSQWFNRRHRLAGHLFQGRYRAIVVQREKYLLELARYVVLNPVRTSLVRSPEDWPWSSYRLTIGAGGAVPDWIDVDWHLSRFGGDRSEAVAAYTRFVLDGIGKASPFERIKHQVILGDDQFVEELRANRVPLQGHQETARGQRERMEKSLGEYAAQHSDRKEAMALAYLSGAYTMEQIGAYFGVHDMTVSRAVRQFENEVVLTC